MDDPLVFDRASGAVFSTSVELFETFDRLQADPELWKRERLAGVEGADSRERNADLDAAGPSQSEHIEGMTLIQDLMDQGFFKFTPVDMRQQQQFLKGLMAHKPRRIQMLMAQGCNLGCRYCYAWRNGSNQKGTLMPLDIAKRSVDYLIERSGNRKDLQVTFFGGEPLLNYPTIRQVVEYCRELEKQGDKKFTFELITNGTLLTEEIAEWVASEKFLLFISIDGWKEMHNYNRPSMDGEDMYDRIIKNAQYANQLYKSDPTLTPIKVRANLTGRYHDSRAVGDYLASLGFTVVGVGAIEPLPHGDPSPSALTEDQMDGLQQKISDWLVDVVNRLIAEEPVSYYEGVQLRKVTSVLRPMALKGVTCGVARNTAIVDNKGNIFPCHRYEGMENYILGDVFTGLDREKTMAYYQKVNQNATNRCQTCWIRDYCGGGCAWLLSKKDGHLADPTERECDRRRKSMERALWLRQKLRAHFPERFTKEGEMDLDSWSWGTLTVTPDDGDRVSLAASCGSENGGGCENCGSATSSCGS